MDLPSRRVGPMDNKLTRRANLSSKGREEMGGPEDADDTLEVGDLTGDRREGTG